jgi:hypothetical protein
MGLLDVAIGTYCSQYRSLSVIRYLDINSLLTRYTLFITLVQLQYLFMYKLRPTIHTHTTRTSRVHKQIYNYTQIISRSS